MNRRPLLALLYFFLFFLVEKTELNISNFSKNRNVTVGVFRQNALNPTTIVKGQSNLATKCNFFTSR